MRVLVVDDDVYFTKGIAALLTRQNYIVDTAVDGRIAWECIQSCRYDLIVLDVMLPGVDGKRLCEKLRQEGVATPILLLTACDGSQDKVAGLDAGADDYVVKPFDWEELLARMRALLRRESTISSPIFTWGALQLDPKTCQVSYAGEEVSLRRQEYRLLELFLRNPTQVFSCSSILENLWTLDDDPPLEETVRAHIKSLRRKLKAAGAEDVIETVYGLGYRLKDPESIKVPELGSPDAHSVALKPCVDAELLKELQEDLITVWAEIQPRISEYLEILDEATWAIGAGTIAPQLQKRAIATAHKLAGTVGAYGFRSGSQVARQIETLLLEMDTKEPPPGNIDRRWLTTLQTHVADLRQELSAPPQFSQTESPPVVLPRISHAATILAVDDDPTLLNYLTTVLEPWGLSLRTLTDPHHLWTWLDDVEPDLLLLDIAMPNLNGLDVCEKLRNSDRWAALPIVFLTAYADSDMMQRAFIVGADDFITKSTVEPELITRLVARIERNWFLQRRLDCDRLTQLANRMKFVQDVNQLLQQAEQQNAPVTFCLLNIANLDLINEEFGYETGDTLLQQIANKLYQSCGPEDAIGRWSGSKFAIALYNQGKTTAKRQLIRISHELSLNELSPVIWTTMAQFPDDGNSVEALFRVVERSLP